MRFEAWLEEKSSAGRHLWRARKKIGEEWIDKYESRWYSTSDGSDWQRPNMEDAGIRVFRDRTLVFLTAMYQF